MKLNNVQQKLISTIPLLFQKWKNISNFNFEKQKQHVNDWFVNIENEIMNIDKDYDIACEQLENFTDEQIKYCKQLGEFATILDDLLDKIQEIKEYEYTNLVSKQLEKY